MQTPLPLILGSTSRYRSELLSRLRLAFTVVSPDVDETPQPGETPADLALRLALAKAQEVAQRFPNAVVIGSDQVADLNGEPIGKPGNHERAVAQLQRMSGQTVVFQTAVAVVHASASFSGSALVPVTVKFRQLSDVEIERTVPLSPNLRAHVERFIQTLKFDYLIRFVIVGNSISTICAESGVGIITVQRQMKCAA